MSKSNNQNSAVRRPLDQILGSQGHVMVLRQLSETKYPTSHTELLERTDLSRQGVYDVVKRLVEYGIVEYVGSGRQKQIILRKEHPLFSMISELFEAERKRFSDLLDCLKEEIKNSPSKPKSCWVFGKVAQGSDEYGDPIRIALLGDVKSIDNITAQFRERLRDSGFEKEFDVTIEINGVTLADITTVNVEDLIMLWGPDPQHYLVSSKNEREGKRSHEDLDHQSLIDSKAWTELLKTYPEIIQRTINYLEDRIPQISSGEKQELEEWNHILESMSLQRLKKFLESDSERSTRLRQSLPFWPVLKDSERTKLEKLISEQQDHG